MKVHQVILRKDGPVHAVETPSKGVYQSRTLCGANVNELAFPKARYFDRADNQCRRCAHSLTLR